MVSRKPYVTAELPERPARAAEKPTSSEDVKELIQEIDEDLKDLSNFYSTLELVDSSLRRNIDNSALKTSASLQLASTESENTFPNGTMRSILASWGPLVI
jgi:conjugal transfer/entry exclusion protein